MSSPQRGREFIGHPFQFLLPFWPAFLLALAYSIVCVLYINIKNYLFYVANTPVSTEFNVIFFIACLIPWIAGRIFAKNDIIILSSLPSLNMGSEPSLFANPYRMLIISSICSFTLVIIFYCHFIAMRFFKKRAKARARTDNDPRPGEGGGGPRGEAGG